MPDNNYPKLPYDRVYFIGNSLGSIKEVQIRITLTFDIFPTKKIERTIPDPKIYYSYRFSNGANTYDLLKALMVELPFKDCYNFAYPGAGSDHNTINFFVREALSKELGSWKNWVSTTIINHHPSFDNQFQQVIDEEHKLRNRREKGKPLVFIWGAGVHNDLISLTYLAGYPHEWTTLPNITEKDVEKLSLTLNLITYKASQKLKKNITKLYNAGVRDFVFFDGLPLEKTPYFFGLKKKYYNVKGFTYLVNNMSSIYNAALRRHIKDLERTFIVEGKPINITYIKSKDMNLPSNLKSVSYFDENGMRNNQPFKLDKTNPQQRNALDNFHFYDPNHLTVKGAWVVASFIADQLRQKEPNIKKHQNQLRAYFKNRYSGSMMQQNLNTLGLGGK